MLSGGGGRTLLAVAALACVTCSCPPAVAANESSDGCGPNPLTTLIHVAHELEGLSVPELRQLLWRDGDVLAQLIRALEDYHDCVRTGDGSRFRRTDGNAVYRPHAAAIYRATARLAPGGYRT